jgi:hypothetical protein
MNIFEALRKDHDKQRALLKVLTDTSGSSDLRDETYSSLKSQLVEHAKYEERNFYKPLIDHDISQDMARHSVAEHKDIDDLIEDLDKIKTDSPSWLKKAKELEHKVLHHLKEEEREVFQLAGKALSETEKIALAEDYEKSIEKTDART